MKRKFFYQWFRWRNWYWGIDVSVSCSALIDMGKVSLLIGWRYEVEDPNETSDSR
jgi:hypothetical protein